MIPTQIVNIKNCGMIARKVKERWFLHHSYDSLALTLKVKYEIWIGHYYAILRERHISGITVSSQSLDSLSPGVRLRSA